MRLVLYRIEGRTIWPMHNEKVLAGLGRDLPSTGRLSADGLALALPALRRYAAIIRASRPEALFAVATAAVREAADGRVFVDRVRAETGLALEVLDGTEEARASALGVIAGAPTAAGVAADLGGGSLELSKLKGGRAGAGVSVPLGPFSLASPGKFSVSEARPKIAAVLESLAPAYRASCLSAVGGAWRSLAVVHMKLTDYQLEIIHQYRLSRREALELCRFVQLQSRSSLERIEGVAKRRVDTLPHAALVLEELIGALELKEVVISAFGLREGLLYDAMTPAIRRRDPLVEGCRVLASGAGDDGLGAAVAAWIADPFSRLEPLFDGRDGLLLEAACALADLGARLHPDHRADLVFDQVLRAPVGGASHAERGYLACAAFARHTGAAVVRAPNLIGRLLSSERLQRAQALGAAIRLACELSGRAPSLLKRARLDFDGGRMLLRAEADFAPLLLAEQIAKRAATLAERLDMDLSIKPLPDKDAA